MASSEPLRVQVQKTIRDLIMSVPVPVVRYDMDMVPTILFDGAEDILPTTLRVNELRTDWEVDRRHGRALVTDRTAWQLLAKCEWAEEVALEKLEEHLGQSTDALRRLSRDDGTSLKNAILVYDGMDVVHPTTNKPGKGTQADLRFGVLSNFR